jgi:D-alanyl-D-alanine carboxypeptidase (penicillin-binding protein 5/6)
VGALPAATPSCEPWQTPTAVPPGVALTPRVFPSEETVASAPSAGSAPHGSAANGSAARPATTPRMRTVCRNAPPVPFPHPAWTPDTVVGGPRLADTGVVVDADPGTPAPPEVYDVSYVLADLTTGEILAAKSPHAWLRPASTLKTLTALTLMPLLDPRKVVVASQEAAAADGSRVGILAGNPYPVASLFDAMLMFSANDAVYTLADAAGGYDRTVALMNDTAHRIGAYDTRVVDPSGLDEGDQRSSAYDLALIAREAMRLPAFRATIVKRDAVFPGGRDASGKVWKPFHIFNINELLGHYSGAVGIKPGRTDRAQHAFIGAATRSGRTLVVAQMGSVSASWKPTAALLDWGFANADRLTPVGRLVAPGEASPPSTATTAPSPSLDPAGAGNRPTLTGTVTGSPAPAADPRTAATAGRASPAGILGALVALGLAVACLVGYVGVRVRRHRRSAPDPNPGREEPEDLLPGDEDRVPKV